MWLLLVWIEVDSRPAPVSLLFWVLVLKLYISYPLL